jgi:glycosyltransferase involved in cell wall biosynthesis
LRILLLAPHPLFSERGSPIATALLLRALSELGDHHVDVLTYPEGTELNYPRVKLERLPDFRFLRGVKPGFSLKKVVLDLLMLRRCWQLCRESEYDVVHCLEETVYIAMLLKRVFGIPYVYDMDSSLAQQMVEKFPVLGVISTLLDGCERLAMKNSLAVVPVCPVLAERARTFGATRVEILYDITLLESPQKPSGLRNQLVDQGLLLVYVGNLEGYQGIELMLESFAIVAPVFPDARLVVAGIGEQNGLVRLCRQLNIEQAVHFVGPWPLGRLADLLADADILVSPRIKGTNTPMKLFSYLHSGKPVLATRLLTHTQIVSDKEAALAEPNPSDFAEAMRRLMKDKETRRTLGLAGQALVEERYTYERFLQTVKRIHP